MSGRTDRARAGTGKERERGSGSVLVLGVMTVVAALFVTALLVATYVVGAHRARSAADLAALSGAAAYEQGDDPCGQARRTARANGARLSGCDRVGDLVDFVVSVSVAVDVEVRVPGLPRAVPGRAHAGPTHAGPTHAGPTRAGPSRGG